MNFRKWLYFFLVRLRGQPLGKNYARYLHEYRFGIPSDTTQILLTKLLDHCRQQVPYYSKIMDQIGFPFYDDPIEYLKYFPVLSKDIIRNQFDELKSLDLLRRKWYLNSTGGSTGEPVKFIQDRAYSSHSGAVSLLFSKLVGREIGEPEVKLWGSIRDIVSNSEGWRTHLINGLTNTVMVNSVLMTTERMREFIHLFNTLKPKLIVTYVESIYELAKFAEQEELLIHPQSAIMTTAGRLYPFMRNKIEKVFRCKVYDRYGSREFGDMACENPDLDGLWVAPWGNYLEIVDPDGNRVPDGTEGDILVTSLSNFAMPLIRYRIGDRGALSSTPCGQLKGGQVLKEVIGRSMDFFKTQDGAIINPGFLMAQLYHKEWIIQYQIIQKSYQKVVYKVVKFREPSQTELEEIIAVTKKAMGNNCEVSFEFVDNIPPSVSGKYRFLISEVNK